MSTKQFTIEGDPIGAPRMTRSDRWRKRPCVLRYFAFRDRARKAAGELPPVEQISHVEIIAYFSPPASWSRKKREAAIGKPHRSKPDLDNIFKAIGDSLFSEDSGLACITASKYWDTAERVEVFIEYDNGASQP